MKLKKIVEQVAKKTGGEIYENYSGRGMFGRTCFGVVVKDATACIEVAAKLGLTGGSIDNMGLQYIVYWPNPPKTLGVT